jgi:hypothetical protein
VPYFTDDVQGALQTGYIAAVCADALTGITNPGMPSDLNAWDDGNGHLTITGLPTGIQTIIIYDALGQVVLNRSVVATSGRAQLVWRAANAVGMYVVNTPGSGAVRLIRK